MKLKMLGIFLMFIIIGFNRVDADSGDTLGSAYTLGRIVGGNTVFNMTNWLFFDEGVILINLLNNNLGIDDQVQIGGMGIGAIGIGESVELYGSLLGLNFEWKFHPSHKIKIGLFPQNFFFMASDDDVSTGLEYPFATMNVYSWDFLSNYGCIVVDPVQYENAFYFGPLLNQGQITFGSMIAHPLGDMAYAAFDAFFSKLYAARGLPVKIATPFIKNSKK